MYASNDTRSNLIVGELNDGSRLISTLWGNDAITRAYDLLQHDHSQSVLLIRVEQRIADDRTLTIETPIIELVFPTRGRVEKTRYHREAE